MNALRAFAAALALTAAPISAQTVVDRGPSMPLRVQLNAIPLGQLATLLMRDVMKVPYAISADVLRDGRPVSVNLVMPRRELPVRVVRFLRAQGLKVWIDGGTVYVSKDDKQAASFTPAPGASLPSGSPFAGAPAQAVAAPPPAPAAGNNISGSGQQSQTAQDPARSFVVMRPAHRSPLELAETLRSLLPGLDVAAKAGATVEGEGLAATFDPDALAVGGDKRDVAAAVALVRHLDRPRPQVDIRAVVFEVRNSDSKASALALLAKIAGVQVESGSPAPAGSQFVRIAAAGVSAVLSATRSDGRFKVVAEPSLAALSGSTASINAGSQVPTLGAVTFTDSGEPVRSVVYRDSGISLTVRPDVRAGEIQLDVKQERSSFARTTTGVDDSPTLNRAAATARLAIKPGEAVLLAGLNETSESSGRDGILGGLLSTKSRDKSQAQLVLLLQADLAPARDQGKLEVEPIDPGGDHIDQDETAPEKEARGDA